MNVLRTDRTYATQANALKALETAAEKIGALMSNVLYVIAVNPEGRFAPVVTDVVVTPSLKIEFAHKGVTIVGNLN